MPLLGRHKPLSGGGQQRSSGGAVQQPQSPPVSSSASIGGQQQRPAVCESPLFGLRRQLPMVTVPAMATTTVATGCSDEQRVGHSATRGRRQAAQQPSVASVNSMSKGWTSEPRDGPPQANENTLGSIPKHITRQQIHYAFSIMDTNSDGLIDVRDLSQMLANLGIPIDESILAHVLTGASKRGEFLLPVAHLSLALDGTLYLSPVQRVAPAISPASLSSLHSTRPSLRLQAASWILLRARDQCKPSLRGERNFVKCSFG